MNAGAEVMAHELLTWLAEKGFEVAAVSRETEERTWEGIAVIPEVMAHQWVANSDVVLTHLDQTAKAMGLAQKYGKPLVHVLHNDRLIAIYPVFYGHLLVANSQWIRRSIPSRLRHLPSLVVHPPTWLKDHHLVQGRDRITLVNLFADKGPDILYGLAQAMPDRRFLAVVGGYGRQYRPPRHMPNLEVWPNQPDMSPVWAATRILLMPSSYESWGKVAIEAMASGIPVIAAPTLGLKESMGSAGIVCERRELGAWREAVRSLDDVELYDEQVELGLARATYLESVIRGQLEDLVLMLRRIGA